jgi:hypothetical protein
MTGLMTVVQSEPVTRMCYSTATTELNDKANIDAHSKEQACLSAPSNRSFINLCSDNLKKTVVFKFFIERGLFIYSSVIYSLVLAVP